MRVLLVLTGCPYRATGITGSFTSKLTTLFLVLYSKFEVSYEVTHTHTAVVYLSHILITPLLSLIYLNVQAL